MKNKKTELKIPDLAIQFQIDAEKKEVIFFIQNGKMENWVKAIMRNHPTLSTEAITKHGGYYVTNALSLAIQKVCEANQIKGWEVFSPRIVWYKSEVELPSPLRRAR